MPSTSLTEIRRRIAIVPGTPDLSGRTPWWVSIHAYRDDCDESCNHRMSLLRALHILEHDFGLTPGTARSLLVAELGSAVLAQEGL